jgi:hypothetical protein
LISVTRFKETRDGTVHDRMEQDLKLKNVSPATRKI